MLKPILLNNPWILKKATVFTDDKKLLQTVLKYRFIQYPNIKSILYCIRKGKCNKKIKDKISLEIGYPRKFGING